MGDRAMMHPVGLQSTKEVQKFLEAQSTATQIS